MRTLSALISVLVCGMAHGQGIDPTTTLEMYQSILGRGDVLGALGYCAMPVGADPDAAQRALESIDEMQRETDVLGVTKALSLFVPELAGPAVRTVIADEGDEMRRTIEYEVAARLTYRQRVHFVNVNGAWRIDLAATLADNAAGTKIESMVASLKDRGVCADRMRALSRALVAYMEANNQRLPEASRWQAEVRPFLNSPEELRCASEPGEGPSIAMNARLSGLSGADIADPDSTVLLFDAHPGIQAGHDESAMARRHDGVANVLLASGAVVSVESTHGLKWGAGASALPEVARAVTKPYAMLNGIEYVYLRDCLEPFGASVSWDATTQTTSAQCFGRELRLIEGQTTASLGGAAFRLPAAPVSQEGKLMLPVSALARAFGLWARYGDGQVTLTTDMG